MEDIQVIRETIIDGPPRAAFDMFAPHLSSLYEQDKTDRESKLKIIQDFKDFTDPNGDWTCEMFPGKWFPLDLHARQGARNWICMEAKHAKNGNNLKTMAEGPSKGAFIPFHKMTYLHAGLVCGFDYAVFVYTIEDIRYYIPLSRLHCLRRKTHPLNIYDTKEGNLSLPIPELLKWEGVKPFMKYFKLKRF